MLVGENMEISVKLDSSNPVGEQPNKDAIQGTNLIRESFPVRFLRQTYALTKKNFIVQLRSRSSTAAQLLVGPLFLLMLLLTEVALSSNADNNSFTSQQLRRKVTEVGDFQRCLPHAESSCVDFLYTVNNGNALDESIAADIVSRLETYFGTPTVTSQSFVNASEIDSFLLAQPNVSKIALIFNSPSTWNVSRVDYTLQANFTVTCAELQFLKCDDPFEAYAIPMQLALDSVLVDLYSIDALSGTPRIQADFADFPHPNFPNELDALADFGTIFLYVAITFNFVIQLSNMAYEKELHLLENLRHCGMLDSAYWMSNLISNSVMNILSVILLLIVGNIFQLELFTDNDGGLNFTAFFLLNMGFTAFAFFLLPFFGSAGSARNLAIVIFITTFLFADVVVELIFLDNEEKYNIGRKVLSLFPHFAFYVVVGELITKSAGAQQKGLTWEDRTANFLTIDADKDSEWSLQLSFQYMILSFFVFSILGWYLDKVLPDKNGYRLKPYFLFTRSYWLGSSNTMSSRDREAVANYLNNEDEDVNAEAQNVLHQTYPNREIAMEILALQKRFKQGAVYVKAVDGISYAVDKDQLMVVLGHNGAGKTTTFNMLTGLTRATAGDAIIFGQSVNNSMDKIRPLMGVCPQHDVLWPTLTPEEHLDLLSQMKGVPRPNVREEVKNRLEDVRLEGVKDQIVSKFSGGMRRRLSISMALIGSPRIVFLDEPTTGMDPVTRRAVWDMITRAKKNRVIILTTHSMEEADILGDRVAIMSKGKLQAIGTSLRLKSKFGSGYRMSVMLQNGANKEAVRSFVSENAPAGAKITSESPDLILFQIGRAENQDDVGSFFEALENRKQDLGIIDYSVGMTTLEEVFLNLAQAEGEPVSGPTQKLIQPPPNMNQKPGFWNQFAAMRNKSIQYQKSQRGSCCCLILFPVFVMLILLLVEILLDPVIVSILCGDDVSKENCASDGPSIECLQAVTEQTVEFDLTIEVGTVDSFEGFAGGFNENCNDEVCFENLENPFFSDFPITVSTPSANIIGNMNYSVGGQEVVDSLLEWFTDVNLIFLTLGSCDTVYENNFDPDEACPKAGVSQEQCIDDVKELLEAREFLDAQDGIGGDFSADICTSSSTGDIGNPPSQALIDEIRQLQNELLLCQALEFVPLFERLDDPAGLDVSATLFAGTNNGRGLLSFFTTESIPSNLDKIMISLGSNATGLSESDAICNVFLSLPGPQQDDFATSVGASSSKPLINLCASILNYDFLRSLKSETFTSSVDMDNDIFNSWYGREVQTPFATSFDFVDESLDYLRRQYYARWGAYEFLEADLDSASFSYIAYYNNSATGGTQHGNWFTQTFLMNNAILRNYTGLSMKPSVKTMPAVFKCNRDEWANGDEELDCPSLLPGILQGSLVDFLGSQFFPLILLLHVFFIPLYIVYEKRKGLLVIMKMMGLQPRVYWLVNYLFYLGQVLLLMVFLWVSGVLAAGVQLFTLHDQGIVFLVFFTWANTLVAFSFLLTNFFSDETSATAIMLVFIFILLVTGRTILDQLIFDPNTPSDAYGTLMILPPLTMMRAVLLLAYGGTFKTEITFENWGSFFDGAIGECIAIMWLQWAVCILLTWYLDKVISSGGGVAEHPLFFLRRDYWFGKNDSEVQVKDDLGTIPYAPGIDEADLTVNKYDDALAEHKRVVDPSSDCIVKVVRLNKTFPNGKAAVKALSLGVDRNECFGLLGHNGAGKTTTINMLVGLFQASGGAMFVDGYDLSRDIDTVRSEMGVCPQHNIMWDSLTVADHLYFYGRLKGLRGQALKYAAQQAAIQVDLFGHAYKRRAGKLSGGMKRRLSVAIALIGDPKVAYLDEPSTGLDPASRRQLWKVINNSKGNKSIVLTTHSMEEADVLCDRIGIMAVGELQCIGTSADLKRRFGEGYTLTVTAVNSADSYSEILDFVNSQFKTAKLVNEPLGGTSKFEIKREEIVLSQVFRTFEAEKKRLRISDWGITETTLEEVFLRVAVQAHVEEEITKAVEKKKKFFGVC